MYDFISAPEFGQTNLYQLFVTFIRANSSNQPKFVHKTQMAQLLLRLNIKKLLYSLNLKLYFGKR
jgi:hypothetical protein